MKIVFLCVANSARSQMAEGLARALVPPSIEVLSAGSQPTQVNPHAIQAMREIGIDISGHVSKSIDQLDLSDVDFVITLCADEVCPAFIGSAQKLHWPFPDPASQGSSDLERLQAFRTVRDQIKEQLIRWNSNK